MPNLLGLDCNLGKDLSKREENGQLVNFKNIGLYSQLYIPNNHEEMERSPLEDNEKSMRKFKLLHETLTDNT